MTNQSLNKSKKHLQRSESTPGPKPLDLDDTFTKLRPFLQLGYSFHKSCLYAEIPYTTALPYYQEVEEFRTKIERERILVNVQARRNIFNAIATGDLKVSLEWLEAMEKEEFSKLQEIKDVTPIDEGIILLREIIMARRLKVREKNELPAPKAEE